MKFNDLLKKDYIIFDGAMGTELQKRGLKPGELSELFNFTSPEKVKDVILAYAEAGSDIVSANTFCANRYKLSSIGKTVEETVITAVNIAKEAVKDYPDILIALDIGPTGKLLKPSGTLDFDEAYDVFAEEVKAGVKAGVDLIALQTFSDLLELKCAILAVKENCDLPLSCSMTFEENKRTFTGCPGSAYAVTASALGADIIGVNCSAGPEELADVIDELLKFSKCPVSVKPNAGLPSPVTGEFDLDAETFFEKMQLIAQKGVKVLGGCCGTSPEYIKLLSGLKPSAATQHEIKTVSGSCVTSGIKTVMLDQPRVIGERINPTGKRIFKEALKSSDTDYILGQALEQTKAGADILDVNVGLPEIDECKMMVKVIDALQSVCDLPLQIDSNDPVVLETALRRYNGKPIVNSVNGKEESLSEILPIVKKYGATVIGLTIDERGIPETAEERFAIAEKIISRAAAIGIDKDDIIIDCLTLTVSTDTSAANETLKAVRLVNDKLGVKTALGVSNVSFGLPNRDALNSSFLTLALNNGLTLPIINPNSTAVMGAVRAFRLIQGFDGNSSDYIKSYSQIQPDKQVSTAAVTELTLVEAVASGMKKDAVEITSRLLNEITPLDVTDQYLIPALDKVGNDYEKGAIFLPQLLLSAETAGACFDVIKREIESNSDSASVTKGKIVLATVKGDVHDIGKNIVKVLLENYRYKVIDLGKDVSPEEVADAVTEHDVKLVGLSALMTTTLPAMRETIELLRERGIDCEVMVGGAVLNADYADKIGADYYAKDAKGAVDIAKKIFV